MMKRILAMLLALTLLVGCGMAEPAVETETAAGTEAPAETEAAAVQKIEMKTFPFYLFSPDLTWPEEFPLYFADGVYDLPYVDLRDWAEILNWFFPARGDGLFDGYKVTVEIDEPVNMVTYNRDNSYSACFDFENGMIHWDDYEGFQSQTVGAYMDVSGIPATDSEGRPFLLSSLGGRNRQGDITLLNLEDCGIPMIAEDGKYLVPLQTLSAFFLSSAQVAVFYNQECLIMCEPKALADPDSNIVQQLMEAGLLTPEIIMELSEEEGDSSEKADLLMKKIMESEEGLAFFLEYQESMEKSVYPIYAAGPKVERSEALINYGFRELCLELDCFYGLKDAHNITDFGIFFIQNGQIASLLDPDAAKADNAIVDLTQYWLDDLHSGFSGPSYLTATDPEEGTSYGFSVQRFSDLEKTLSLHRARHPEAMQEYYEVGNTAYVTFDDFDILPVDNQMPDYYGLAQSGELPNDTIGKIIRAHQQITRKDSPIENVVLDLSCNGGGAAPVALFTLGWFLGDAQISIYDPFTGAESTNVYRADVNLDHAFDERDTISNLNLYCLISPNSFSCGNLVPWAFKEDGRVTLLGKVSGGGSCVVLPMTTAWGTSFQISGHKRISFVKNGAYYDVDRGVEPDYIIRSYDHFFDREALTAFINGLY